MKQIIIAVFAFVFLISLLSFASFEHGTLRCNTIEINIKDDQNLLFIEKDEIKDIFKVLKIQPGEIIKQVDLESTERVIKENPYVKTVQVYNNIEGRISVILTQKKPFARIITKNKEYYLDETGKSLPVSEKFSVHVPVFNFSTDASSVEKGVSKKLFDSAIYIFVLALEMDSFAKALCGQIIVENDLEMVIVPRLGNFKIHLGDIKDLDKKFKTLKAFYATVLPKKGWEKYSMISLKYKNQVIANQ